MDGLQAAQGRGDALDRAPAIVQAYVAAYNAMDVPALVATVAEDVMFRGYGRDGEMTASAYGRDEFETLSAENAALFRSRRQNITGCVAAGPLAALDIAFEGVLAVDLGAAGGVGDVLRLTGAAFFEIRDGAITRLTDVG